MKKLEWNF